MTETSPIEDMSHLQSQMNFDESTESIAADSDLEDGEIKKLLTSQLYAQKASGRPDAMVIQEREVRAQTSHHHRIRELLGDRLHCFHGVLCSETLMCRILSETLPEGNKDHLLNRARTDLATREIHVESLNKCIKDSQKRAEAQDRALQDVQNEFVEFRREQTGLQEE